MKLKTLYIFIGIITAIGAIYAVSQLLAPTNKEQPIARQTLLPSEVLFSASQIKLHRAEDESSLIIEKDSNGSWVVVDELRLPVDFRKLQNLIQPLLEANIVRVITDNPERMERLGIGAYKMTINGDENTPIWSMESGEQNASGGVFVKVDNDAEAILIDLSSFSFETDKELWIRKNILDFNQSDVAQIDITFSNDAEPIVITRESPEAVFSSASLSADQRINQNAVLSLIDQLTGVNYEEIVPLDSPEVKAAKNNSSLFTVTLFNGFIHTLELGSFDNVDLSNLSEDLNPELNTADNETDTNDDLSGEAALLITKENTSDEEQIMFAEIEAEATDQPESSDETLLSEESIDFEDEFADDFIDEDSNLFSDSDEASEEFEDFDDFMEQEFSDEETANKNVSQKIESLDEDERIILFSSSEELLRADALSSKDNKKSDWLNRLTSVPFLFGKKDDKNGSEKETLVKTTALAESGEKSENKKSRWGLPCIPYFSKNEEAKSKPEEEKIEVATSESVAKEMIGEDEFWEDEIDIFEDDEFWENEFGLREDGFIELDDTDGNEEIDFWDNEFAAPEKNTAADPEPQLFEDQETDKVQSSTEEEYSQKFPAPNDELSPQFKALNSSDAINSEEQNEERVVLFYKTTHLGNPWEEILKTHTFIFPKSTFEAIPESKEALIETTVESEE